MDFGALPPEINSGRMYSGPGSGPLLAASAAWRSLAAELNSTASTYDSVVSGVTSEVWAGPSSATMAAAVCPYITWMKTTAAQAEQSGIAATAAAAAYDVAFTATVPPPVIAGNRSLLAALVATNILGQNTPAIAATEAHYGEMWAQDAAAMYGYAGAAATAARLVPFGLPPPATNATGLAGQAAAVAGTTTTAGTQAHAALAGLIAMLPQALQTLAVSGPAVAQAESPILALLDFLAGPLSPISLFGIGGIPYLLAIQCVMLPMNGANVIGSLARASAAGVLGAESTPLPGGPGAGAQLVNSPGPAVSAGIGNAASAGRLSVPQAWATTIEPRAEAGAVLIGGSGPDAAPMAAADAPGGLMSNLALGGLAGRAIGVTGGAASRAVGAAGGVAAAGKPAKASQATIIVIPPSAAD